jgi:hypothetical protein
MTLVNALWYDHTAATVPELTRTPRSAADFENKVRKPLIGWLKIHLDEYIP